MTPLSCSGATRCDRTRRAVARRPPDSESDSERRPRGRLQAGARRAPRGIIRRRWSLSASALLGRQSSLAWGPRVTEQRTLRPRLPSDNWLTRFLRAMFSFFAVAAAVASLFALAGGVQLLLVQPLGGPGVWLSGVFFFAISSGLASVAGQQWIMGRPHDAVNAATMATCLVVLHGRGRDRVCAGVDHHMEAGELDSIPQASR
jgi:hypothetical protein